MLERQVREFYIKRNAGDSFDELNKGLGDLNQGVGGVVRFDDVLNHEEVLDGGRGNPNMRLEGVCYSDGEEIRINVNGNKSNRTLSLEMRYSPGVNGSDVAIIKRVLGEQGFVSTEKRKY